MRICRDVDGSSFFEVWLDSSFGLSFKGSQSKDYWCTENEVKEKVEKGNIEKILQFKKNSRDGKNFRKFCKTILELKRKIQKNHRPEIDLEPCLACLKKGPSLGIFLNCDETTTILCFSPWPS